MVETSTARPPLRLWPGVVAAVLLLLVRFVAPLVMPDGGIIGVLGALVASLLIAVWWMFFSRAPWPERLGVVAFMIVAVYATRFIVHPSISGGLMGRMLPMFLAIPGLSVALVAATLATRKLAAGPRRLAIVVAVLLACGMFALVRTDGITGAASAQMHWRWTPTHEELLLAQATDEPLAPVAATAAPVSPNEPAVVLKPEPAAPVPADGRPSAERPRTVPSAHEAPPVASESHVPPAEWPGFRGPNRDDVVRGVQIETDWTKAPPIELWRREVGPGWSSFAVRGNRIYTQEQRGENEIVACYDATTGKPVWMHRDAVRFYESNGGPGPRGTPTVDNGRVYTQGATGVVNALDARTGTAVWSRNAAADTGATIPGWGFAGSPLVIGDAVIVAASGRLVAYDSATGHPRWTRTTKGGGYSSPHALTVGGIAQVVLQSGGGATGVAPADGALLWEHEGPDGVGIVQPARTADGDLLTAAGDAMGGIGLRRLAISRGPAGWSVEERWTSRGLKPYFNDFVVHAGHAFGFDGSILACVDLADGARTWKGGRYGNGQLLLLAEQDLLLVLSEEGELALVRATPDRFTELARFKAIEGKTWNHPVLVGDVLYVRNGEEMAAFRLPLAKG